MNHMGYDEEYRQPTREELNAIAGDELPERAAMSLINANVAAPINAAVALNVLSDNSVAYANAQQTGNITQSNWGDGAWARTHRRRTARSRAKSCTNPPASSSPSRPRCR